MKVNTDHLGALLRNYRTAYPNASDQLALDYATDRYLDSNAHLAHKSQAEVDGLYDLVYNEGTRLLLG